MTAQSQAPATTSRETSLAFDRVGSGVPVVLLPGLTFGRRTWRPIVERLRDDVCTVAVDLPAQGDSGGPPRALADVAAAVHRLVERLGIEDPVVVGHSMSGAVAMIYAASYPARGAVIVDSPPNVVPFAELVQRLEPALRGPGFAQAFEPIEQSLGIDRIPEPVRSEVLAAQEIRQDLVLGYWDPLMRSAPEQLQARADEVAGAIAVPVLAVFGERLSSDDRDRFRGLVPGAQLEEWPGRGHFVHLAEPTASRPGCARSSTSARPVAAARRPSSEVPVSVSPATVEDAAAPRMVVGGAFALLTSLRALGSARVSELQRDSGLPRTTVHRLLRQLEQEGAVDRTSGRWRLGPTMVELGAAVPAEPRLRSVARRPLMDLARATHAMVGLSVEMAGEGMVIDVLPGKDTLPCQPEPGMSLDKARLAELGIDPDKPAALRAHAQAHRGDLRPIVEVCGTHEGVSVVAAPLRLPHGDVGAVWLMLPSEDGIPAPFVAATRRTAGRIASQLSQPI